MEKLLNLILLATNLHGLQMPLQHFRKSRDETSHPIVGIGVLLWFWQQNQTQHVSLDYAHQKKKKGHL